MAPTKLVLDILGADCFINADGSTVTFKFRPERGGSTITMNFTPDRLDDLIAGFLKAASIARKRAIESARATRQ